MNVLWTKWLYFNHFDYMQVIICISLYAFDYMQMDWTYLISEICMIKCIFLILNKFHLVKCVVFFKYLKLEMPIIRFCLCLIWNRFHVYFSLMVLQWAHCDKRIVWVTSVRPAISNCRDCAMHGHHHYGRRVKHDRSITGSDKVSEQTQAFISRVEALLSIEMLGPM